MLKIINSYYGFDIIKIVKAKISMNLVIAAEPTPLKTILARYLCYGLRY